MGFYEIGNGCDSCDTISSVVPNNVNMQMDSSSSFVANMAMPYGAQQNATQQQYNNSITSSGYPQQGNNMGMMGNGSNGSTLGAPRQQQQVAMQPKQQVVKQVVTTTTTTPSAPSVSSTLPAPSSTFGKFEGFTDGTDTLMSNEKKWIVLGLVIFSALSLNECCKYFLNKSLQLNDGSPMYYVAYAGVAILLTMAANKYSSN